MGTRKFKDRSGEVYGRLTILYREGSKKYPTTTDILWRCRCSCGTEVVVGGRNLLGGSTKSCGCLRKEVRKAQGGTNTLPDGMAALNSLFANYKSKASRRGYPFELSKEEFKEITQKDCHYCGQPPSLVHNPYKNSTGYLYNGVDRTNNSEGYLKHNVVACCSFCNRMKSDLKEEDFINHISKIFKHKRKEENGSEL